MNSIISFNTKNEFNHYLKINGVGTIVLGSGFEGTCYKSTKNKYAYKILLEDDYYCSPYEISSIITTDHINLKSFAFPIELFAFKEELIGYTSKSIDKDLFSKEMISDIKNISQISFDKLLKAYFYMLKDIEKLSEEQILINNLAYELLFNGTFLTGIDTCGYIRKNTPVLKENIEALNEAIITIFEFWTKIIISKTSSQDIDIEEYLNNLKKEYTSTGKIYTYK